MERRNKKNREVVIIPKKDLDFITKKLDGDCLALYSFYVYTANWQHTNQPQATNDYCMKGLKWGHIKLNSVKTKLINSGLIKVIKNIDKNGKILGWYIRVNHHVNQKDHTGVLDNTDNNAVLSNTSPEGSKPTRGLRSLKYYREKNYNENALETSSETSPTLKCPFKHNIGTDYDKCEDSEECPQEFQCRKLNREINKKKLDEINHQ